MGENDYETGYRGHQFHHGMDRAEYERGKAQKELIDTLGGAGKKTEVDGVTFTLLLVAPLIWMVYPVLGFTLIGVCAAVVFIANLLPIHGAIKFLIGVIVCVMSFFWGAVLEAKVSQVTVYRWIRGVLRIIFAFGATVVFGSGADLHDRHFTPQPGAIVGGFFVAVIAYLAFQRMDLIYFPAKAEIKKMQEKLARGERPTRPLLKRMFFGACWLIPVVMVLNLVVNIGARMAMQDAVRRQDFYDDFNAIIFCGNAVIWYALCFTGKLPGTGKYMFNQRHEEDLRQMEVDKAS